MPIRNLWGGGSQQYKQSHVLLSKRFFNIFGSVWNSKPYIRAECRTIGPNTVYRQVIARFSIQQGLLTLVALTEIPARSKVRHLYINKATCLSLKRFLNIFGSVWKPYIRAECRTNGPYTVYRQVIARFSHNPQSNQGKQYIPSVCFQGSGKSWEGQLLAAVDSCTEDLPEPSLWTPWALCIHLTANITFAKCSQWMTFKISVVCTSTCAQNAKMYRLSLCA